MLLNALVLPFAQPRLVPVQEALQSLARLVKDVRQVSPSPHWLPLLDAPSECPQSGTLWMASPYSGLPPPFRRWPEAERPRGETPACRTQSCAHRATSKRISSPAGVPRYALKGIGAS